MLNASQKRTKRAAFVEASMSRQPRKVHGIVCYDAGRESAESREAAYDVSRAHLLHFDEDSIVYDMADDVFHVVGFVWIRRDESFDLVDDPIDRIVCGDEGRVVAVVRGNEAEQLADERDAGFVAGR